MFRVVIALVAGAILLAPAAAQAAPELSTSDQLKTRRYVAAGERAYVMGFQDGRFYAQGWHVTGEMGGVWSQPLKLVDGVWFGIDGEWLGARDEVHERLGLHAHGLPRHGGAEGQPHRLRARRPPRRAVRPAAGEPRRAAKTVNVKVDAHSEVMSHYPWAWTTPNAGDFNLADSGALRGGALVFHDTGTPHPNAGPHDWVAVVGSNRRPDGGEAGAGHWGSQSPPVTVHGREPVLRATRARSARAPAGSCATS